MNNEFYKLSIDNKTASELGIGAVRGNTATVKTPKGSAVTVIIDKYKGDSWSDLQTTIHKKRWPLTKVISKADNRYNCHSYAWYQQSTSNIYWINGTSIETLIMDQHCAPIPSPSVGDIIVYRNQFNEITHSGVVTSFENGETIITSKWDVKGLYRHSIEDVLSDYYYPSSGYTYSFYRYSNTHTLYYTSVNDTHHVATCNKGNCDYSVQSSHVNTLFSDGDSTHTYYCLTCGHSVTENHSFSSYTDSYGTASVCGDCGYTSYTHIHDYTPWEAYSSSIHRRLCEDCYYMEDEAHVVNSGSGRCEKCGY